MGGVTCTTSGSLQTAIATDGYAFVHGGAMREILAPFGPLSDWPSFADSWNALEFDGHMADGGRYRRRRYGAYTATRDGAIIRKPHQPHFQAIDYNPLNGGVAIVEVVPVRILRLPVFAGFLKALPAPSEEPRQFPPADQQRFQFGNLHGLGGFLSRERKGHSRPVFAGGLPDDGKGSQAHHFGIGCGAQFMHRFPGRAGQRVSER